MLDGRPFTATVAAMPFWNPYVTVRQRIVARHAVAATIAHSGSAPHGDGIGFHNAKPDSPQHTGMHDTERESVNVKRLLRSLQHDRAARPGAIERGDEFNPDVASL